MHRWSKITPLLFLFWLLFNISCICLLELNFWMKLKEVKTKLQFTTPVHDSSVSRLWTVCGLKIIICYVAALTYSISLVMHQCSVPVRVPVKFVLLTFDIHYKFCCLSNWYFVPGDFNTRNSMWGWESHDRGLLIAVFVMKTPHYW